MQGNVAREAPRAPRFLGRRCRTEWRAEERRERSCLTHLVLRFSAIPRAGAMRQGAYLIYREHCTVLPINWYAPLAHFLPRLSAIPRAGAMRQGAYLTYREH